MAEFGAHVTSTVGEKPSIFEVLAQQNLENGLRAAFRHLFKVLANNSPEQFSGIQRYFEELYTVFDLLIQYVHLKIHGASFAESFYGLKRMPVGLHKTFQKSKRNWLPKKHFYYSLLLLTLFPYIKVQLLSLYNNLKDKDFNGDLERIQVKLKKLSKFYIKCYPYFHFILEFVNLIYQVSYAIGKSAYHSPLLHLSNTQLRTLTHEDQILLEKKKTILHKNVSWKNFPYQIFQMGIRSLAAGISIGLSTGAFFLQFLDWWYSQHNSQFFSQFPIPPPPKKWSLKLTAGMCPLCHQKRRNETVLSTSGFVFCYRCIFQHLKKHSCCPITNYPSTNENLIKLYLPQD